MLLLSESIFSQSVNLILFRFRRATMPFLSRLDARGHVIRQGIETPIGRIYIRPWQASGYLRN